MSSRKRPRSTLNANDDVDELSPLKPASAPLTAVKKRKMNTYGQKKKTGILGSLANAFGLRRSGQENIEAVEEKDELAHEGGGGEDIWDVPDDDGNAVKPMSADKDKLPTTPSKGASLSQKKRRYGSADSKKSTAKTSKKDIYEVDSSEDDTTTSARSGRFPAIRRASDLQDPASKIGTGDDEVETPRRGRGRPPKHEISPPKKSPGKPRKSDILKKAKTLSREAAFHAMIEEGRRAAESENIQSSTRRRSARGLAEGSEELADSTEEMDKVETSTIHSHTRKHEFEVLKGTPKGILTPTKDRNLKAKKSVAFEGRDNIDLGFKDLPDSANKISKPNNDRDSEISSIQGAEVPTEESQDEEDDDVACSACNGLDSETGHEIIFCDSCDFAVHWKCYGLQELPQEDWFCRDCLPQDNEDPLGLGGDEDLASEELPGQVPKIERLEYHLQKMQRILLDRLTGQKKIKLRGHEEQLRKVHQVIEQTVLAGEGNSMLVIGARGCGKTTLVESVIADLSVDHRENFHVVRLNGFIHTDDKLALKEIWRQLGREMDAEDEMTGKANHADTLASLLALLSHPSEISEDRAGETAKSVVFVLDEFDLFTTHSRQTLLYNLFDIAQARKAPIVVLGLTTRVDVVEALEKRVKSRFSHRYVYLSLPQSLPAFWDICKEGLLVGTDELENEGFDLGLAGSEQFSSFWQSSIENMYNSDVSFRNHLQSHFFQTKSVPAFFTSCILPIANLSVRNLPLNGRKITSNMISLSPPDSKLYIIQGLSELELALLIAAARLDIILDTDTCNFAMAYDEYSSLTSRHRIQSSSSGVTALGSSAKVWSRDVALGAWERLAEYNLLVPAGFGGGSAKDFGAGGRMWKVDVGLEEISGSVESLSSVMSKWCREI